MRKTLIVLGCMSLGMAHAQQDYEKRVGINTDSPRASLEVKAVNNGYTQGILFPHIDENEKARWTQDEAKGLVAGTVIWNTTKLCLDYFDGTNWQCTDGTKTNVHPTKWTQEATSFTGTATWGDDAGEVIRISKNNCPTGQTGAAINYPVDASQHITYTATSTVSQEDANQKAIALMNAAEKQQERQRQAQEYANQNGVCRNPIGVEASGFDGAFTVGSSLYTSPYHYVKFKVRNDGSTPISNIDLSRAVTVTGGGVTILSSQNTRVSVAVGEEKEIIYQLGGTLTEGTITANFNHSIFGTATQQKDVKDTRGYCYTCVRTDLPIDQYKLNNGQRTTLENCGGNATGIYGGGTLWIDSDRTQKSILVPYDGKQPSSCYN